MNKKEKNEEAATANNDCHRKEIFFLVDPITYLCFFF
jgi:3'-phosphoadenosine 5'-phosphosulfate (PAPS) 3'-phosphatase